MAWIIDANSKVFLLKEFVKDKYKFNLFFQMLEGDTFKFISDEENYIIGRGEVGYPTWIWTRDGISLEKVYEIEKLLEEYLTFNERDKFTCKKELYEYFVSDNLLFLNKDDYFEMGTLCCYKTRKPRATDGYIDTIEEFELSIIAKYWFLANSEMNDIVLKKMTMEKAFEDAKKMFESGGLYVWRNKDKQIVCMATYKVTMNTAKISHVYTPLEKRGRAYATNLIYEMTNMLLARNLVPLLYTDYNYIASNKAYINAGYESGGVLINFTCSKSKKRI